jgi:hypothetical protein
VGKVIEQVIEQALHGEKGHVFLCREEEEESKELGRLEKYLYTKSAKSHECHLYPFLVKEKKLG